MRSKHELESIFHGTFLSLRSALVRRDMMQRRRMTGGMVER